MWEGTYASLLTEQKAAWHRAAAQWYAHHDPVLSAEHLERAQDPRAARAYLEAARAEKALHHMARAAQLLERGAALATTSEDRIELLAELGGLLPGIGFKRDSEHFETNQCIIPTKFTGGKFKPHEDGFVCAPGWKPIGG
ncbi:MAG: hypothetical protein ACREF4_20410 [Gammaproteobacteria bacterium]